MMLARMCTTSSSSSLRPTACRPWAGAEKRRCAPPPSPPPRAPLPRARAALKNAFRPSGTMKVDRVIAAPNSHSPRVGSGWGQRRGLRRSGVAPAAPAAPAVDLGEAAAWPARHATRRPPRAAACHPTHPSASGADAAQPAAGLSESNRFCEKTKTKYVRPDSARRLRLLKENMVPLI